MLEINKALFPSLTISREHWQSNYLFPRQNEIEAFCLKTLTGPPKICPILTFIETLA